MEMVNIRRGSRKSVPIVTTANSALTPLSAADRSDSQTDHRESSLHGESSLLAVGSSATHDTNSHAEHDSSAITSTVIAAVGAGYVVEDGSIEMTSLTDTEAVNSAAVDNSQAVMLASTLEPEALTPIPDKRQQPIIRNLRHTYWAVYQRLFSLVAALNAIALAVLFAKTDAAKPQILSYLATAAASNIMVAILIRQEYIINLIFKTCWMIPHRAPLRIRRMLAKVYEFGGVHSGTAFCSTAWFIAYTVTLTTNMASRTLHFPAMLGVAWTIAFLLVLIIATAIPIFRMAHHNIFEVIHRFVGWLALALFWVELFLYAAAFHQTDGSEGPTYTMILIREPAFWLLLITTGFVIWPWLLLRKLSIKSEKLSDRAIRLHFTGYHVPPFCGIRISKSPLFEWHPFACIATETGGSILISDGGDWTKEVIARPENSYYIKGIPVTGVLNMAQAFKLSVIVTTGSGIGPCLSYLVAVKKRNTCRIIWSAPSPTDNFGEKICKTVMMIDPDAKIINTDKSGRPDLVALTYQMYVESGAEAVFIISNPRVTQMIRYAMETRGVPAYGPVWDS